MRELKVAENITTLCNKHNMSVVELSEKTGIHRNQIWYYKRGKSEPSIYSAGRIADVFNMTIDELCFGNLDGKK